MQLKKLVLSLLSMLLLVTYVSAQVTTGRISGVVKDAGNVGLEGASIKVTNLSTGTVYTTQSRKGGKYDVLNVNSGGPYKIEVTYVGKNIEPRTDLFVRLGEEEVVDFYSADAVSQLSAVTVNANKTSRSLKSGASSNFGQRLINSVPNISRSIANITQLTPQAGGNNSFGGRDGRFNNITIDGANFNNNMSLGSNSVYPGGALPAISLDAIDEISVAISPYDSKLGNFTGANIAAVTRKGTNEFHGSVYGFLRNEGLQGRTTNGNKVPTVQSSSSKIYGGRLGGPIIKNKLFFFVNGEYEQRDAPGVNWVASRPGAAVGPNTSRVLASDLDSVSRFVARNYGYQTGPYENFGNFLTEGYRILGRLDWNITKGHTFSFRYNYSRNDDDQLLNGNSAPNPRSSSNRWSNNSMSYQNSNYRNTSELSSYAAELKSSFGNNMSNQLLVTYTSKLDPSRSSSSSVFPFVDIQDGAATRDNYISFGYELFSFNNFVDEKILTINDNFTYNRGNHSFSAGFEYQQIRIDNSFQRYGTSYYRYNNMSDFFNNAAPNAFGFTYPYAGREALARLDFGQLGLYLQDEIKASDRLKLTLGIRLDQPFFFNDLAGNQAINNLNFRDINGSPYKIDVSQWPGNKMLFNPRFGFNWDVEGNRNTVIRGGGGLFSGRFPFVWFTNMPTNSGSIQNTVELVGNQVPATLLFNTYYNNTQRLLTDFPNLFPSQPGNIAPGSIASVDRNFRMPQVFRASLAVDKKLTDDLTLTLEGIYNKDINALFQYNANQAAFNGAWAGPDTRPIFTANNTGLRRLNPGTAEAMVLSNTSRGGGFVFTSQINKRFNKNWDASFAYTLTYAADITGNPGSQAASAWSNVNSFLGQNNLPLSVSEFATPHRFVGWVNWRKEYLKHLGTTISLVYTGFNQGRFSYRYSNDANNDGNTSDLIYIPKDESQINFVTNSGTFAGQAFSYTAAQQREAFFNYVAQDKYLSRRQGQYAERNGALLPFLHTLDLRILQDVFTNIGRNRHTLQFSVEIENFTNLLNNNWGVPFRTIYNNGAILAFAGLNSRGEPTFRMNAVNGQLPTRTFEHINAINSTWRANLGLRYTF